MPTPSIVSTFAGNRLMVRHRRRCIDIRPMSEPAADLSGLDIITSQWVLIGAGRTAIALSSRRMLVVNASSEGRSR